jgi:four helix bundle protein
MEWWSDGEKDSNMEPNYRNKNRGYQKLRVWHDAVDYYVISCQIFRAFPYELKRVASQAIACADSVHRNTAEGYCRRSIREYLQGLNIGLGSLGEPVSGLYACLKAKQISDKDFQILNDLSFKLENGLLKLVQSLERKRESGDWTETLIIRDCNIAYG